MYVGHCFWIEALGASGDFEPIEHVAGNPGKACAAANRGGRGGHAPRRQKEPVRLIGLAAIDRYGHAVRAGLPIGGDRRVLQQRRSAVRRKRELRAYAAFREENPPRAGLAMPFPPCG